MQAGHFLRTPGDPSRSWRAAQTAGVRAPPAARTGTNGRRRPPQRRRAAKKVNVNGDGRRRSEGDRVALQRASPS